MLFIQYGRRKAKFLLFSVITNVAYTIWKKDTFFFSFVYKHKFYQGILAFFLQSEMLAILENSWFFSFNHKCCLHNIEEERQFLPFSYNVNS